MAEIRYVPERRSRPWQVRYYDPAGRRRGPSFRSEGAAKRFRDRIESDKDSGKWVDPRAGKMTFAELAREHGRGASGLKRSTRAQRGTMLRSQLQPRFGSTAIRAITTADARAWVADMEAAGLSASWVRKCFFHASAIMDSAVSGHPRRLVVNPFHGVKVPKLPDREQRFLTEAELERLADALEARRADAGLLALLGGYAGPRYGEMAAIRRRACRDILRLQLHVTESLAEVDGEAVFDSPKNRRHRTIRVAPFLSERLAERLTRIPDDPDALVFTAPAGGPLRYRNFRRDVWDHAVTDAGLEEGLTPHALRHTCAAILIAEGWSPKRIQQQLGHASIAVTFDVYGHLFRDDDDALMLRLDARRRAVTEQLGRGTNGAPAGTVDLAEHRRRRG